MYLLNVNIWAVLLSTVASFILGGLWYSLIFGRLWEKVSGSDANQKMAPAVVYPVTFVLNLVAAFIFGYLFQGLNFGSFVLAGILAGLGLLATAYAINYLGAGRSPKLLAIDAGFQFLRLSFFGLIFGLFAN